MGKPLRSKEVDMKRLGGLFDQIADVENLRLAFYKASKHKRNRRSVQKIEKDLDGNLKGLHEMLISGEFHSAEYHTKIIHEPKTREIYILPFWPDRVVQHAILNILEPIWQERFVKDSYACIKGRGQHKGSVRCMQFVRHNKYVWKSDRRQFYPSLSHDILKAIIRQKLKDKRLLELLDDIIDSMPDVKGVPIGNLMSQWFGNLYMSRFDDFVKHRLHCKAYIRYCDDALLFTDDKGQLRTWKAKGEDFLQKELGLMPSKSEIYPVSRGVDFLGYRHFPEGYLLVRKSTAKRTRRRLKAVKADMEKRAIKPDAARGKIESAYGLISFANSYNLMGTIGLPKLRKEAAAYEELCRADKETADK